MRSWQNIFLKILAVALVAAGSYWWQVKAASAVDTYACNDPQAKWNRDYDAWPNTDKKWNGDFKDFSSSWPTLSGFKCDALPAAQVKYYTKIASSAVDEPSQGCERTTEIASCPAGQFCIRRSDCVGLGGVCVLDNTSGAPLQGDIDCQTGVTKNIYSFNVGAKHYEKLHWRLVRFRCPAKNKTTCWIPVPEPPPQHSTGTIPDPGVHLNVGECCRQIVPKINHETQDYGLNHVVQVAINVYECILCIVGALILLMLVVGSVFLLVSAGNENLVTRGKQVIAAAVVGGIIVFASFLIVNFVVKAFGASFTNEQNVEISPQG